MSVKVANTRFIFSSLRAGFYQQLLRGISDVQELGSKLVYAIETANSFRQSEKVEELGLVLVNSPIKEHQLIGKYYQGVCAYRKGEDKRAIFEDIIEKSRTYKSNGLISLAAVEVSKGNLAFGMNLYTEAMRSTNNPSVLLRGARSIAIIKSMEGFHKKAAKDLESLIALARKADPIVYYNHLNSLALEFMETGRIIEAQNISKIVLASPFINAYPEWRETGAETALKGYKSRSVVLVPELPLKVKVKDNVVPILVNNNPSLPQQERAKVLDLQAWIEKMVKEQNDEPNDENVDKMDRKDLLVKLLELTSDVDIDEEKLRKVVKYTVEVMTKK